MYVIQIHGLKSSRGIIFFWSVNLNTFGQSFKQMSRILVTGGCGYIGSHTIVDLIRSGYEVLSLDSLVNSDENVLSGIEAITGKRIDNVRIDLKSSDAIHELRALEGDFDGVIHFAALKSVGDSTRNPLEYYRNNVDGLINILYWVKERKIPWFIFSSSCTVYGDTDRLPVVEDLPFLPAGSPYGRTKQMCELILADVYHTFGTDQKAISLRYFNPAGAHESHLIGESPINDPQNLVPIITETAFGKRPFFTVFGTDYPTRDGSCIRDYIHVMDLARAHTLALDYLKAGNQTEPVDAFNLGIGDGVSVLEAIKAFEEVNNIRLSYKLGSRRAGDLPAVYANIDKAAKLLNWHPQKSIEDIMSDAWTWEQKRNLY